MDAYYPMLKDALGMFLFLGIELSALFILISAGVSLLQQYIPDAKVQALLSGSGKRGYVLAALLGSITPFCSCSTIPMLRGLLKAKAGFGPTLTFLFTSPLLNPIIVGLFVVTFGPKVTVAYVSIALIVSIFAGFLLARMGYERYIIPENEAPAQASCCGPILSPLSAPQPSCCSSAASVGPAASSCCGSAAPVGPAVTVVHRAASAFWPKVRPAFREAWGQFKQVFPYLLLGVSLGAVIYGFVPSEFIAEHASGDSLFAVPIAAVIGIPLYVRAEALIPLSAVLVGKGMGLGAVMALIIGGGGASLTEVILLKSMFRMPMIIAFLAVILGMAILAGYLFQFVF